MNTHDINSNEQNSDMTSQADGICKDGCDTDCDINKDPQPEVLPESTESETDTDVDCDAENTDSKKKKTLRSVVEYTEILAFSVLAVLLIFSFMFRVCVVDGQSMYSTLDDGQKLITENIFYTPKQGDIIVFYEGGDMKKPLVKRVIATGGQTVCINNDTAEVSVDGKVLDEDYILPTVGGYAITPNYSYDPETHIMTVTVPEGELFVMGDNRNNSHDSRLADIGCIDQSQVLGKVIIRISPFTVFN